VKNLALNTAILVFVFLSHGKDGLSPFLSQAEAASACYKTHAQGAVPRPFSEMERHEYYSKRFHSLEPRQRQVWLRYSNKFQYETKSEMTKAQALYIQKAKEGDPSIQDLLKLGFRFEPEIYVPSLFEIFDRIHDMHMENVRLGLLDPKKILAPGIVLHYYDPTGLQTKWSGLGEVLPEFLLDKHFFTPTFSESHLGPGPYFSLIEHKHLAMGPATGFPQLPGHTVGLHDIFHHLGMARSPRFMEKLNEAFAQVDVDAVAASGMSYYAVESAVIIRPGVEDQVPQLLGLEKLIQKKSDPSLSDVLNFIKTLSSDQIANLVHRLKNSDQLILPLGGDVSDPMVRDRSIQTVPEYVFIYALKSEVSSIGTANSRLSDKNYQDCARLVRYLLDLSKLRINDWIEGGILRPTDPNTSLYRFLIRHQALRIEDKISNSAPAAEPSRLQRWFRKIGFSH